MVCPFCKATNDDRAEACFVCGKALFILTLGTLLAGRYEILGPAGQGGMSRVYKAHDRVLSETVAIKVLRSELSWDPVLAARFLSEIKLARKVSHRNVCRIHEYGEDRGLRYISMELIEGTNLKDRLRAGGLPPTEAFDAVLQVAEGLQAVHELEIIHRDLKTSNIMIDPRGLVKLMDFGIAKLAEAETDWSTASGGGHVVGTPEYMSPEQARGGKLDFRSDIYSLGCVVFEIFTGRAPFKGQTPVATLFKHANEDPPLLDAELPQALVPVLQKCLAKTPEERFGATQEFIAAIRAVQAESDRDGSRTHAFTVPASEAPESPGAGEAPPPAAGSAENARAAPPPPVDTFTLARSWPVANPSGSEAGPQEDGAPWSARGRGSPFRRSLPWAAGLLFMAVIAFVLRAGLGRPSSSSSASSESPPSRDAALPAAPPVPATLATASRGRPEAAAGLPPAPSPGRDHGTLASRGGARIVEESARAVSIGEAPGAAHARAEPGVAGPETPNAQSTGASRESNQGVLTLLVVPASEVTVDGVSLGTFSLREIPLSTGGHTLRILHPQYEPLQRKVQIRSGENPRLVLDLAEKGIPKTP